MARSSRGPFCVYVYRDSRPGKWLTPIYVGKGSLRTGRHRQHLHRATNVRLIRKLQKMADSGLVPLIEKVAIFDNEQDAFAEERRLIALYGRLDLGTGTLCNATDGGEGAAGSRRSDEERDRLRRQWASVSAAVIDGTKRAWRDPDARAARIAAIKASRATDEVKKRYTEAHRKACSCPERALRISESLKAYLGSESARRVKSEASRRNWQDAEFKKKASQAIARAHNKWWIVIDGTRFGSAKEAARELGVTPDCITMRCRKGIYQRELKAG